MAIYHLARCYEKGCGVPRDASAAENLYRRAAKIWKRRFDTVRDPEAALATARCYRDGAGLPRDEKAAACWFAYAEERGIREAGEELRALQARCRQNERPPRFVTFFRRMFFRR